MEHHLPLIGRSPLFANIDAADLAPMLQCLGARKRTFPKGSYLFRVGDRTTAMGIMLEGSVRLEKEDYGQPQHPRIVRTGPIVRRSVCLRARPGLRHQRGGSRRRDRAVPGHWARDHHVPVVVRVPRPAHPQPAGHRGEAHPRADAQNRAHHEAHDARQAAVVPLRPGGSRARQPLRHPVRPPGAGRLPVGGPQCHVRRAVADERDGLIDYNRNQFEIVRRSAL